jgi:translation initiation factor IF-2
MNLAELARKLRISLAELRIILPKVGFDVGARAIKIDDRTAQNIIQNWSSLKREYEKIRKAEAEETLKEEETEKGVEARKEISIPDFIVVRDLAATLGRPVTEVIRELMKNGILASLNEKIDFTTASIIAEDLGFKVKPLEKEKEREEIITAQEKLKKVLEEEGETEPRPPVVVVMGHVDHGKTKILDYIRQTNVVATEAGGITQHIGAYQAEKNGRRITFIDTPGHEAFTVMRSRGARVADIAVLVVAADDGVQPQTVEALKIISAAKLPFVVAINKIDKPNLNLDRVKSSLSELGYVPEEYGGKVPCVPVSAKTGQGMDALLDVILLIADLEKDKIRANPERNATGTVIESNITKGEGPVATVLIQAGTLHRNDPLVINEQLYGRVRAMKDWCGAEAEAAPPSMPVKILGFKVLPEVGEILEVMRDVKSLKFKKVKPSRPAIFQAPKIQVKEEEGKEKKFVNLILKADVLGSLEAIVGSLEKVNHPEVGVKIVSRGLGNISEGDILSAEANKAAVYGFNVIALPQIVEAARNKGVLIKLFNVIYDLFDDVNLKLEKLLSPEYYRTMLGKLKVLSIFWSKKNEMILGGMVADGYLKPNSLFKILRDKKEVGEGKIETLQSAKQNVKEVRMGSECGVKIRTKDEIKVGDVLDVYIEEEKKKKLII